MPEQGLTLQVQQPSPLLIDAGQVATLLGIGRSTFFALVSSGRIGPQPIRFGRRRLYQRAEVEQCGQSRYWLSQQTGVTQDQLCRLMQGRGLSVGTAEKLLDFFGYEVRKRHKRGKK